jgi:soluble lytic murein transglycosylase-like protein
LLTEFWFIAGMMRFIIVGALCIFVLRPGAGLAVSPSEACRAAATAAEHRWHLPPNLIAAIGSVESGGSDRAGQRLASWPWTVNANGSGVYFPTRAEAIAFVRALQARGVRMIDVGCFQIDLRYHPQAFATLEDAFEPDLNADYAGRFLTLLYGQTGSWQAAIARYHSARLLEGAAYQAKVLNEWHAPHVIPVSGKALLYGVPPPVVADRFVVVMSAAARAVKVIRPTAIR